MESIINYTQCPVCGSSQLSTVLSVKDHSVSSRIFPVAECSQCSFRFTQEIPDSDSIGPYYQSDDYISHTNTQKGLVNRLYHIVRNITLRNKRSLLSKATGLTTGRLLDIGAGTGAFASFMAQSGWQVTGLEPDAKARKIASEVNRIQLLPITDFMALPNEQFDAITLWHVLEHVHELAAYMNKLKSLLKPKGRLFIAVPNYTSYDASHYKEYWAAYDVPRHLYHFSPEAMKVLVQKNQLQLKSIHPMWYDSFYVSLLSEKYKTGKSNLVMGAFTGAVSNIKTFFDRERCSSIIYCISR